MAPALQPRQPYYITTTGVPAILQQRATLTHTYTHTPAVAHDLLASPSSARLPDPASLFPKPPQTPRLTPCSRACVRVCLLTWLGFDPCRHSGWSGLQRAARHDGAADTSSSSSSSGRLAVKRAFVVVAKRPHHVLCSAAVAAAARRMLLRAGLSLCQQHAWMSSRHEAATTYVWSSVSLQVDEGWMMVLRSVPNAFLWTES